MELNSALNRIPGMGPPQPSIFSYWREWPLWRLLGVLAMFGAIARWQFGVALDHFRQLPLGLLTLLEISLLLSLFSGFLGCLVLNVYLLWPMTVLTKGNLWFFEAGQWIARRVVGQARPQLCWALAYATELALFYGLFFAARLTWQRL